MAFEGYSVADLLLRSGQGAADLEMAGRGALGRGIGQGMLGVADPIATAMRERTAKREEAKRAEQAGEYWAAENAANRAQRDAESQRAYDVQMAQIKMIADENRRAREEYEKRLAEVESRFKYTPQPMDEATQREMLKTPPPEIVQRIRAEARGQEWTPTIWATPEQAEAERERVRPIVQERLNRAAMADRVLELVQQGMSQQQAIAMARTEFEMSRQ